MNFTDNIRALEIPLNSFVLDPVALMTTKDGGFIGKLVEGFIIPTVYTDLAPMCSNNTGFDFKGPNGEIIECRTAFAHKMDLFPSFMKGAGRKKDIKRARNLMMEKDYYIIARIADGKLRVKKFSVRELVDDLDSYNISMSTTSRHKIDALMS